MYLKRLELQGFKSFAPRTTLEFSPGITAIVGPNGSGKSNLADAIRWVLGEQSMRQLRGKKSDDIIFAGGQGRAATQMAEVGLVLDNSAAWLPTEHTEVTATRRSFRSGENEYLVNGQRVRLRDLLLLLAQARIGHDSYTVVGQGLVDQALSLRAEERRGLFEDAAGIRQFQAQRSDAEQKLTLTQSNLARLHDILGEIEPRLAPLAEQARRARDYAGARDELRRLLGSWYTWQWSETVAARERSADAETEVAERIEGVRAALAEEDAVAEVARTRRETSVARAAELRRARGEATGRLQALERDLAVGQERRASLERQAAELGGEQEEQKVALAAAEAHADVLDTQVRAAEEQSSALAAQLEALESTHHNARREQEREEARLRGAQRDAVQVQARLGAAQTELGRLQRQVGERNRTLATRREAVATTQRKLDTARNALQEGQTTFEAARGEVEALAGQRAALTREIAAGQEQIEQARAATADAQRERRAVADRLALLEEWHRGLEGYAAGVRAILQAEGDDRPAVIGVMARLVRAKPGFEVAVEGAMGPFLEALAVASADDALACARWLRADGAGQALVVWPPSDARPEGAPVQPAPPADGRALLGPAATFLQAQPELQTLLERLLAGIYVVRDLEAAQQVLDAQRAADDHGTRSVESPVRALVTLAGEVLSSESWLRGGSYRTADAQDEAVAADDEVTGESVGTASTLLARERELRQLPSVLERLDAEVAEREARQTRAGALQQERRVGAASLEREAQAAESRAQGLARQVTALQREEERARGEQELSAAVATQLAAEVAGLEQEVEATAARVAEQEAAQQEALERVREAQEGVDELAERHREQLEELARQRTALALQRQEAKALAQRAEQLRAQAREVALQLERRAERVEALAAQRAQLDEATAGQEVALAEVRGQLRQHATALQEQETAAAEAERELTRIDRDQALARQQLNALELEYRTRIVEAQRARDAVDALATQVREEVAELGAGGPSATGEPEAPVDLDDATTLLRELLRDVSESESPPATPLAVEDAARLRRQIDQLRGRLRHLGGYDPDAPQAYQELKTRFDFLMAQVRDMEQAATNLRTVIAELDTTMRRQFAETFQAVNLRFQRHFTALFSGGSARLELTAPRRRGDEEDEGEEDAAAADARGPGVGGVEVYVQIPGKRVQDLALLSGGERAMVSAALLFALLETNPPPFCLLDEVDAALDEANVVRFCDILKALAEQTQFVVITHNRVTMTHAGAIYGVSMGSDSVSRVLSMRLAEVRSAR